MGHRRRQSDELDELLGILRQSVTSIGEVFSLKTAPSERISRAEIRNLLAHRRIHRIRHGAYVEQTVWLAAHSDPALMRRLLVSAAMVGLREPAYAYGQIAAELHGLPIQGTGPSVLEIVRPQGRDLRSATTRVKTRNRLEDIHILGRELQDEPVTCIHGIPAISLASATVTAAAQFGREFAIGAFDAALRSGISTAELMDVATRWRAGKGVVGASRLIELARPGAESVFESISRVRIMDRGIPEPELQQEFYDSRGLIGRVDMWWPDFKVVGEADGFGKYDDIRDLRAEKLREDRLRRLGLIVVRWTWDEIWSSPLEVVARIDRARRRLAA